MDSITGDMIKNRAKELGADIAGVASVDRFKDEAGGYKPADLLPGAKSVISVGIRQLRSYLSSIAIYGLPPTNHQVTLPYFLDCPGQSIGGSPSISTSKGSIT